MKIEEEVAKIIDPLAYCMAPEAYGLKTEREMLERTYIGPARAIALGKAKRIIEIVKDQMLLGVLS